MQPINITHALPKHEYFTIILPYNQVLQKPISNGVKVDFVLTDPKDKTIKIKAQAQGILKYKVNEIPKFFSYPSYGLSPDDCAKLFKYRYPQLNNADAFVSVILLRLSSV